MSHRVSCIVVLLLVTVVSGAAQVAKSQIGGTGIEPLELTVPDLAKMARLAVDVRQHYEGVRLSDLLLRAGVTLGEKLRGKALATYVVARASDGYGVVYSLAELDPAMNDNQIIVADTMNGKALEPKQGPFKVVVPGDKRPARWIRMVNSFEVENALSPSGS
jgi:DMSO/TMAO reductase YedYZ molybdopterin-dependent catalytic subunit